MLLIHLFPREVDDFDNLANQLKVAAKYITSLEVSANIILNLNPEIIKWDTSRLSKDFIISKFKHSLTKFDWCTSVIVDINETTEYWGYLEQRVEAAKKFLEYDGYLLLDPDMILDDYSFYGLERTLNVAQVDEFIISPQMYKFWDSSWDVISHDTRNYKFNVDEFDPYIVKTLDRQELTVKVNKEIKFAGGWFNYISASLYKQITFPEGVKGYGPEDTFMSIQAIKRGALQYIIEGIVVQENRKYLNNSMYADYIDYDLDALKQVNTNTKEIFAAHLHL